MRPRRVAAMALPVVVFAASQVGHLLAWELRHGPPLPNPPGSGVHAYVPALTTVVLGLLGAVVVAALLVVAAARVVLAGRGAAGGGTLQRPRTHRLPLMDVAAALFALQLGVFLVQETAEAVWLGSSPPGVADMLLWGSLGQLPVAIVCGAALSWLGARFEAAVEELKGAASPLPLSARPAERPVRLWTAPARQALLAQLVGGALSERGPPVPAGPSAYGR